LGRGLSVNDDAVTPTPVRGSPRFVSVSALEGVRASRPGRAA
jgi:hypothetical protein